VTEPPGNDNTATVIIPTYNAGQCLIDLLDNLQTQTLKPAQIIVIDSGSTDGTADTAAKHGCKIIKIEPDNFDHGTTRNLAVSSIQTEFVVFLTQDAMPVDENMIIELIKPMQADSNIAVCYGRQLPRPGAGPLERLAREFNYPAEPVLKTRKDIENLGIKTFFCSNSCSAIRRSIFNKLGGFKNNVIVNEDMLFAAKAILHDYSVYYSAKAKVFHSHSYSLLQTFKRYYKIGRFFADNQEIFKHAGLKSYGGDMLKVGVRTFWRERRPQYIIALLIELIVKAAAFKFGWYYQLLFHKKHKTSYFKGSY
jgi:rhamnosyltransferase